MVIVNDVPCIYQVIDGEQVEVAASSELVDTDTYTFAITGEDDRACMHTRQRRR